MRPRVLFVGAFPPPESRVIGGIVTDCRRLLGSSFRDRLDLDLLDTTQISNPPPPFPVRLVLAMRRFARFVARIQRQKPQIVLVFTSSGASLLEKGTMAWYARLRGIPAVMFPRGSAVFDACARSCFARFWARAAFRAATQVFCQSTSRQRFFMELLGSAPQDAPVIPSWTATPELLAIGDERSSCRGTTVRFLFFGWLEREKGVEDLLFACRSLHQTHQFELDIVGEGTLSRPSREFVEREGLSTSVRFHGWLPWHALLERLATADVFVLPSWGEGLPNSLIEAMATRLAVVVTSVGGVPDILSDGEHGLLVPPRDIKALERAMARLIDDADLRHRLADAGNELAAAVFGTEHAVEVMIQQLNGVIEGRTSVRIH